MFISTAYAEAANSNASDIASAGVGFGSLWVFIFIFIIMYFLVIRPQRNQYKQREAILKAIKKGDKVVTAGGIVAIVKCVSEDNDELLVEIAPNVEVNIIRTTIGDVIKD